MKRDLFEELTEGFDALAKERTYQNREQGRGKPNEQAALLFRLVERKPEIIKELRELEGDSSGNTAA